MMKKFISFSLVAMMLTMTAIVSPALLSAEASGVEATDDVFTYGESKIISVTEGSTTHSATLTAWDGKAATDIAELTTTTIDGKTYYQITSGADLAGFANYVNSYEQIAGTDTADDTTDDVYTTSANAILVNDINLNSKNWKSFRIGTGHSYKGTFDGNGHTIYNFYISAQSPANDQGGLFRSIATGAVIKDLNFENAKAVSTYTSNTTSVTYTAIVCGIMNAGTIQNVNVSGIITVGSGAYANSVGSIASVMYGGDIKNCYSDATIDLSTGGTKTNDFSDSASTNYGIGGIVGQWNPSSESTIENCGFGGTINAPYSNRVGGIVGNLKKSNNNRIIRCYNTGNITGCRQVAGIMGWNYNGTGGQNAPRGIYNTGNIVAKSATNSYAAGLINGLRGPMLNYPAYSTGNVSVEDGTNPEFNGYCALLYTTFAASTVSNLSWEKVNAAYLERTYQDGVTTKAILSAKGTHAASAEKINKYTATEFTDGTAAQRLYYDNNSTTTPVIIEWTNLAGLNNGYPVFTWQTSAPLTNANTYYVKDGSLALTLDRAGYVTLEIAPLGASATVNEQTITEKGTYTIEATNAVTVDGQALITIDLTDQKAGTYIDGVEAEIIRFSADTKGAGVVILALFDSTGTVLKKTRLYTSFENMTIDLRGEDVSDCMLKAFILKDLDTLEPVTAPYILDAKKTVSHEAGIKALDGKKVIFIGNSHVYYGRTVIYQSNSVLDQESRNNNQGGFYKLCKANGIDVSVTNWTFSGHGLTNLFRAEECSHSNCAGKNINHESYLTDKYYDYVFINPGSNNNLDSFKKDMDDIMTTFKEANPNVKFIVLGHASLHGMNADGTVYDNIIGYFDELEEMGVTIANWGYIAKEAMNNGVEGSQRTYNKNTFVVTDDGFHPNLLAGYLTTVTSYCAVTGEKAVNQPHAYVNDFDIQAFIGEYYPGGDAETDFPEILASGYEMKMFKRHIDKYLTTIN